MNENKTIAIVDDYSAMRDSLSWLFSSRGHVANCFASGTEFLKTYQPGMYRCIILDVRMPEMSGLEVFKELRKHSYCCPVLFLTGHGDVAMAVEAIKNGASEFIQKPCKNDEIVDIVEAWMERDLEKRELWHVQQQIKTRLDLLTTREHEVMELILSGKLNKQVADKLGIAIKTVEVHRSRILEKMSVKTALALSFLLRNAKIG